MKIKVDIVSGFLGAGKTTFIKKLIGEAYKDERVFVLENEFGKVGIDGEVLKESKIRVKEINSGCICCSPILDFMETLAKEAMEFRPDRIIVEPTGVALLSEVIAQFSDKAYEELLEINLIISVVDTKKYDFYLSLRPEFIENQIRAADCIVLSKRELIDEIQLQKTVEAIKRIKSDVKIITEKWDKIDFNETLFSADEREEINHHKGQEASVESKLKRPVNFKTASKRNIPKAHNAFSTFETESQCSFTEAELFKLLNDIRDNTKYGTVLRGKGIVNSKHSGMLKFDYTAGDVKIENFTAEALPRICFIGIELNKKALAELI